MEDVLEYSLNKLKNANQKLKKYFLICLKIEIILHIFMIKKLQKRFLVA